MTDRATDIETAVDRIEGALALLVDMRPLHHIICREESCAIQHEGDWLRRRYGANALFDVAMEIAIRRPDYRRRDQAAVLQELWFGHNR
jgi:hypothetical protein